MRRTSAVLTSLFVTIQLLFASQIGFAAGTATISGVASIDTAQPTSLNVCFFANTLDDQYKTCSIADSTGNYSIDLPIPSAYYIDLEGVVDGLSFRSSLLKTDTPQTGTLNLTLQTQQLTFNINDQFSNPVSGSGVSLSSIGPMNNASPENTVQFSTSGTNVYFPGITSWSHSSNNTASDSQGVVNSRVLKDTAYGINYTAPPATNYSAQNASGNCRNDAFTVAPATCILYYPSIGSGGPMQFTNGAPSISWTSYPTADHYSIYRQISGANSNAGIVGQFLGTVTGLTYTDTTSGLAENTYAYSIVAFDTSNNVLAVSTAGQEKLVIVDKTAPSTSGLTMSKTSINSKTGPVTVTITSVSDTLAGMGSGEYYIDVNPGNGHGTPMSFTGTGLTATATTLSSLSKGAHTLYARAVDRSGNWSSPLSISFSVH